MDKDTLFYKKRTIRCNNRIIELDNPLIMGILNVTPDSFFDGGNYMNSTQLNKQINRLIKDGTDIIDVGACSTRPGAEEVSEKEELIRLDFALDNIRTSYPDAIISVDTFRSGVARHAIEKYNVDIINDISAGTLDPEIVDVVAEYQRAYVAMHMQGTPKTMQINPNYEHVVKDVIEYFSQKLFFLQSKRITDIIIDPGFGFGKTIDQNYRLLAGLNEFKLFEHPILTGLSRKSMIYKFLNTDPDNALSGTIALNLVALQKGSNILRVHDVAEAKHVVALHKKLAIESEKSINLLKKKHQ